MPDTRTFGYVCPICGEAFMIRSRFEDHRDAEIPAFAARQALARAVSEGRWRSRQREIGRLAEDGTWVEGWRPGITEGEAPFDLSPGDEG